MNSEHTHMSVARDLNSRMSVVVVFLTGVVAGAGLLGVRWIVRSNADPFDVSWPLYLQLGSFAMTVLFGSFSRRSYTAGLGLFIGMVLYMFVDGSAEYPVASMIALTIHGLLPALAGALCFELSGRIAARARNRGHQ